MGGVVGAALSGVQTAMYEERIPGSRHNSFGAFKQSVGKIP